MSKLKYDLVFSFGPACSCSQTLRRAGLQLLSFPFDWISPGFGTPLWNNDVRFRADMLAERFGAERSPKGFLHLEDFVYSGDHTNGKAKVYNKRLGINFLHDFPIGVPLEESFPAVKAKYTRRENRLLELIGKSANVLIARLDRPDLDYRTPDDDCRYARELLSRAFAPARFDFLLIQPDASVPFGNESLETVEPGFFRLAFDYGDRRPGADRKFPRFELTSAAVAEHFAVRDYRTKEEIAAHRLKERQKRWAKYGASNALQYGWHKFLSHFRKGA